MIGGYSDLIDYIDGAFVVVVETSSGKYRRRVWLTLAPAERAAARARAEGHRATVVVAALKPLHCVESVPLEMGRLEVNR